MSGEAPRGRWDPFDELGREVSRLVRALDPRVGRRAFPPINLHDAGDRYWLAAELPGHEAARIELTLAGDVLTIAGERRPAEGVDDERYRRRERPFGRWSRSVALPGRVDGERVSARYALGVLTVELPKAPEPSARQIAVRAESSGPAEVASR
jgi:HSP20 family protein